jgi:hypothetical protein
MAKIVCAIDSSESAQLRYEAFDQDIIRIGRAFDNDLIIHDLFINAHHACIRIKDGRFECEDYGSLNGIYIVHAQGSGGESKVSGTVPFTTGAVIHLGKTSIRVYDSQHIVAPPLLLKEIKPVVPHHVFTGLVIVLCQFYFVYFILIHATSVRANVSPVQILLGATLTLLALVIWSALWAAFTRFARHQPRFVRHLTFGCQWAVLIWPLFIMGKYATFFAVNEAVYVTGFIVVSGCMGVFILSNHLAIAANMTFVKRTTIAGVIVLSLILIPVMSFFGNRRNFVPDPGHYINLAAIPKRIIPSIPVSEAVKRLDTLFKQQD